MKKKLLLSIVMLLMLQIIFSSCSNTQSTNTTDTNAAVEAEAIATREFVDSVGRTVTIPKNITKIAATGNLSQIALLSIANDKFAGLADKISEESKNYFNPDFANLTVLGQLYGGKGDLNLESLLNSGAEVVIDIGEPKSTIKDDLDNLTEQTGIPFIHISFTLETLESCYEKLGELFDRQDRAKEIIAYCKDTLSYAKDLTNKITKKNVAYLIGADGLNAIAEKSYFSEVLNIAANNAIKIDEPSSKGTGDQLDMEQLIKFNPDFIVFDTKSMYDSVKSLEEWKDINAIKNNNYYLVPTVPYNILGFPPSIQKIIGIKWLMSKLYPEDINYNIEDEFKKFYKMFYDINLTDEQTKKILHID